MQQQIQQTTTLALFCKVVDNYGDIGICWRFARQLAHEHGIAVNLWVDDLVSFKRLCPDVRTDRVAQIVDGIDVTHWRDQNGVFAPQEIADIVIEFFGCDIPPGYIARMAQRDTRPLWFNFEGLSAEEWVEGCHTLPSPHPSYSLTKYFFFPGFTNKTGGLMVERDLRHQRQQFLQDPAQVATFLSGLGVTNAEQDNLKISLFCYPHAPLTSLFTTWTNGNTRCSCNPWGADTACDSFFAATRLRSLALGLRSEFCARRRLFCPRPMGKQAIYLAYLPSG